MSAGCLLRLICRGWHKVGLGKVGMQVTLYSMGMQRVGDLLVQKALVVQVRQEDKWHVLATSVLMDCMDSVDTVRTWAEDASDSGHS